MVGGLGGGFLKKKKDLYHVNYDGTLFWFFRARFLYDFQQVFYF